jgi:hypothetical protein
MLKEWSDEVEVKYQEANSSKNDGPVGGMIFLRKGQSIMFDI